MDKLTEERDKEMARLKSERESEVGVVRQQLADVMGESKRIQQQSQKDMDRLTQEIGRYGA